MAENFDVRLRPLQASDSARLLAWRNLPDIRRWMYTDHHIPQAEHDLWFAAALSDAGRRDWIIEAENEPAGLVSLTGLGSPHRRGTLGYYLADPALRGRGVGAFAKHEAIEQGFAVLGLNKLWCEALVDNAASIGLLESLGFRREALFRAHVIKAGRPTDVVGLGLLASDWASCRDGVRDKLRTKGLPL